MACRLLILTCLFFVATSATTACTSRDEQAATAATTASDALQQGNLFVARLQITKALGARDDVSDYWLLSGRIALAETRYSAAFEAFESALTLDRSNVEALTRLCQLAVGSNQPERAEHYADQLAQLRPGDRSAVNVQAALALSRGDKAEASRLIDKILADSPDDSSALITRSRLFSSNEDYVGAARAAEASLAEPGDTVGRLQVLKEAYVKGGDATGYRRTIARLARASPRSTTAQLDYARSLYDAGDPAAGFAVTQQVLTQRPGDVGTADAVLHLWLARGAAAMPVGTIVTAAANAPPETRAAFAGFASALGHPDLALQALGDAGDVESPATAVNNAKVARAEAQALLGRRDVASAILTAVLTADPDQPRALTLRGSMRAAAGNRSGAIEDLRHALAADPGNANARLALADVQVATGDGLLAITTLHDGLEGPAADPRLATRLARLLLAQGHRAEAVVAISDYKRANPFSPRPPD